MPSGSVPGSAITGGRALIVSLNDFVTVDLSRVVAKFSAFIVIVDVPGVVGVPVM